MMSGPFLNAKGMDVNDVGSAKTKYLVLGYPASGVKKNFESRRLTTVPVRYVGNGVDEERYRAAGVADFANVAVEFDKKNSRDIDGATTAPSPDGMNGCGVWRFDSLMSPGATGRDRLVAVFTDHIPRRGKVLVATRVSVHIELLRSKWPEFADGLPPARRFKANVRSSAPPNEALKPTAPSTWSSP